VNEAVDRVIVERGRLDAGLSSSFLVSLTGHLVLVAVAVAAPLLMPRQPLLRVADGFAVALPRGGGGSPRAAAPPAVKPEPKPEVEPEPVETAPEPPPKVLKPPREQAPPPDALPEPDSRRRTPRATPPPRVAAARGPTSAAGTATPGLEFGSPGPGVPDGTDTGGDWYLAGVQQKIWILWNQQIKTGFTHPIGVRFTILADGNVADVDVTQPSGASLLDMAAKRAVLNAAPFGPLPRQYETDRKTIQAVFRPTGG
jgi:TonB family protein